MKGSLPEVSISVRLYSRPQVSAMRRPVSMPPVNATMWVSGCSTSCLPRRAAARDHLHEAARQRVERRDELQRRERGEIGGLDDDRVAARERRGGLPAQQAQRIVEGQDDDDDAERILGREMKLTVHRGTQHLAVLVARDFRVVVDGARGPGHLVGGLLVRLAHLAGQHFGDQRPVRHHAPRDLVQQLRAPVMIDFAPSTLRRIGRRNGPCDIVGCGIGDFPDAFFGRRIDDGDRRAAARSHELTVDPLMSAQSTEGS